MSIEEKIKIIKDCGIDFLGYDEIDEIIEKIIKKSHLQQDLLKSPKNFWEDAKNGILVYSEYITKNICYKEPEEQIVTKYQDLKEKKHIPALVYVKQLEKTKIR